MLDMPDHRSPELAVHLRADTHYPAHESLQQYAARRGLSPREAYPSWHDRPYPAVPGVLAYATAMGPGLGLHLRDLLAGGAR